MHMCTNDIQYTCNNAQKPEDCTSDKPCQNKMTRIITGRQQVAPTCTQYGSKMKKNVKIKILARHNTSAFVYHVTKSILLMQQKCNKTMLLN